MMKVAIIARSTLYSVPGGDTVQAVETSRHLNELGLSVTVKLTNEPIVYEAYDLLHFFNLIRPADILFHLRKAATPFVVSTILVDYSEYDRHHRKGAGMLLSYFSASGIEYVKTIARWLTGKDHLCSYQYLWKGQWRSMISVIKQAKLLLPNSASEFKRLKKNYPFASAYSVIPNGINHHLFKPDGTAIRNNRLVICVARIEGIKNQLNLIRALNDTEFNLLLIGAYSPNQAGYYRACRSAAAANVTFIGHLPQINLLAYYQQAKVHILPSWFETTGLSSLEAAAMGCNIVITDKGDTREYFGDDAFYCNPGDPADILKAVKQASLAPVDKKLSEKIFNNYTWKQAAEETYKAYQLAIA
jgi:glycosyltransferase involved in cell wall biosynthesis